MQRARGSLFSVELPQKKDLFPDSPEVFPGCNFPGKRL